MSDKITLDAILSGITEFSNESQDHVKQFIANADMIHTLATSQTATVLTVIRARLVNASRMGDISALSWDDIKKDLKKKYIRADISFETAQERLLSIKQNPKEDLEAYSGRIRKLLRILNTSTIDENAAVQSAQKQ